MTRLVALGDLLTPAGEVVALRPDATYREVTVRLWGKGVVERRQTTGANIAATRRTVVRAGQFILSRIDARNGACGLVPESLDGAIVSNDFPVFGVRADKVVPAYLGWITRAAAFVDICRRSSEGTTNRVRLQEDRFLQSTIPLHPLEEQRRVVAKISSLDRLVTQARETRRAASLETLALPQAASAVILSGLEAPTVPLGDIAEVAAGVTLGRKLTGPTVRVPYLRVANVQDGHLDLSTVKEVEVLPHEVGKWQLQPGDVLLTEGGDWDKLGRGTLWNGEIAGCIHQNHIFRVRLDQRRFRPDYIAALVASPLGKKYFQTASKQTTNLASINQRQLKAFRVFDVSLDRQQVLTEAIRAVASTQARIRRLQEGSQATIDALLPCILDKAFKGEL